MARAKDPEMAMVKGGQLCFCQTLHDSQHGGINKAERQIAIPVEQFTNATIVLGLQVDYLQCARLRVSQKAQERVWMQMLAGKPINLNEYRRRDEDLLVSRLKKSCADVMISVGAIHGCVERSGIADQRHVRGW